MLVRRHQQGLLPALQCYSVGGGQFEVLCRKCGSAAKEGEREEDEIERGRDGVPTNEQHATARRACATDVGRCNSVQHRPGQMEAYVHPFERISPSRHSADHPIAFTNNITNARTHYHVRTGARPESVTLVAERIQPTSVRFRRYF